MSFVCPKDPVDESLNDLKYVDELLNDQESSDWTEKKQPT